MDWERRRRNLEEYKQRRLMVSSPRFNDKSGDYQPGDGFIGRHDTLCGDR